VLEDPEIPAAQPGMQALSRGLMVLDLIAQTTQPARFIDILDATGLSKGTLHRILQTLIEHGYLRLDERNQTYCLGSRPFQLAHRVWDQFDLRGAAAPELDRLCQLTGETVRLGVLDEGQVLYIDQREQAHPIRLANAVGSKAAVHASALGKAIMAHLDPSARKSLRDTTSWEAFTGRTIVTDTELDQQLNIIKARGYAVSVEEQHVGVCAVAAPVLDHRAQPLGAIGIIAPSFRLGEEQLHALGRDVIEAARRVAGNIGELAMSISIGPRPESTQRNDVRCQIPGADFLAEGPHWSSVDKRLYWVDILAPAMISGDPVSGYRSVTRLPELVGVVIPRRRGGFVAATESGIKLIDESGALHDWISPEADKPGNRFNDGKCDRHGRLWVGSLAINTEPGQGALWRIETDGTATLMQSDTHVSNGLGWSPDDRTFYFTDSAKRVIYAYEFDIASGELANRRTFATVAADGGVPDGLTVDADGFVWSAQWDGWCLTRYDPDGKIDRVITLPVPRPTSCTFGGPDLSTLYITTARVRLSSQQLKEAPLSGSVLAMDTAFMGQEETCFGG